MTMKAVSNIGKQTVSLLEKAKPLPVNSDSLLDDLVELRNKWCETQRKNQAHHDATGSEIAGFMVGAQGAMIFELNEIIQRASNNQVEPEGASK